MGHPPTRIGPYHVLGKLGEGGMGAVYEAQDETTASSAAIKVLHAEYAKSEEFLGRFFNEARAVNHVSHPGLVQVSDYGTLPDGTAYIVMELLHGESLSARLKRSGGSLPAADVLRLVALLADSLAAAHDQGIVHRDLKPENIMIIADAAVPGGERTKLLDFGIAKLTNTKDFVKTKTNAMMGTPVYMSPEQCRGAGRVDDRADVYSLGVLLFVMLSGRPPFTGEGLGDIMGKHMYEQPPPLELCMPEVAAPLADLVARLLLKDKQQRPPMREVVATLEEMAKKLPSLPKKTRSAGALSATLVSGPNAPTVAEQTQSLNGQSHAAQTVVKVGSPLRRVTLALFALLALALPGAILISNLRGHKPAPAVAPALVKPQEVPPPSPSLPSPPLPAVAPRAVRWQIDTMPSGAYVSRDPDGKVLCQTPCVHEQLPALGQVQLRLRRDGFVERVVQLAQDRDVQLRETLAPARRLLKGKQQPVLVKLVPSQPAVQTPAPPPPVKPEPPVNRVKTRPKIED